MSSGHRLRATAAPPIDFYDVRYRISGSWTNVDSATVGTTLSYTITGLTNDSEYQVQVQSGQLGR